MAKLQKKEKLVFTPKIEILYLPGKHPMFSYTVTKDFEIHCYSAAMSKLNAMHNLGLFHQISGMAGDGMGLNGWEIWRGLDELNEDHFTNMCEWAEKEAMKVFVRWYANA